MRPVQLPLFKGTKGVQGLLFLTVSLQKDKDHQEITYQINTAREAWWFDFDAERCRSEAQTGQSSIRTKQDSVSSPTLRHPET